MIPNANTGQPLCRANRLVAGALAIAVPAGFLVFFTALQVKFDYPDILRKPAAEVLARFAASQGVLLPLWYGMFASALLFIPLSVALASLQRTRSTVALSLAIFGAFAGLVQTIGLSRWVFAVPVLAARFASDTSAPAQASVTTTFDTVNALLGVGIGEHLGYIFTTTWTLILVWAMRGARPISGAIGTLGAAGIAAGLLEPLGWSAAATLNALGYSLWSLWLMWLGVLLLRGRSLFSTPSDQHLAAVAG